MNHKEKLCDLVNDILEMRPKLLFDLKIRPQVTPVFDLR